MWMADSMQLAKNPSNEKLTLEYVCVCVWVCVNTSAGERESERGVIVCLTQRARTNGREPTRQWMSSCQIARDYINITWVFAYTHVPANGICVIDEVRKHR